MKDADFLMFDEATSDLNTNFKREVQRAIESMDTEYGIIAIAHRLSTVENADVIYTLEAGRITESGTHDELVANDGKYAELYAIQPPIERKAPTHGALLQRTRHVVTLGGPVSEGDPTQREHRQEPPVLSPPRVGRFGAPRRGPAAAGRAVLASIQVRA